MVKESELQEIYEKILKFAALRPRSEKEFKDWLAKHKVPKKHHGELFNRLKRIGFLDDKKFAFWWVEQRSQLRQKSVKALYFELRSKGIDKEIIEKALNESEIDELAMGKKVYQKNSYRWQKFGGFEKRKKISEFLLRRGFGWNVIKKLLDQLEH